MSITIKDCQEFAEVHNLKLGKFAEKIIERVNVNRGYCPCKSEEYRNQHPEIDFECPCSVCLHDVNEFGHCCCNLYIKKD